MSLLYSTVAVPHAVGSRRLSLGTSLTTLALKLLSIQQDRAATWLPVAFAPHFTITTVPLAAGKVAVT